MSRPTTDEKILIHLKRIYPEWVSASELARDLHVGSTQEISSRIVHIENIESRNIRPPKEYRLLK